MKQNSNLNWESVGYSTSDVKDLNSGLQRTGSLSGQGEIWTHYLRITSLILWSYRSILLPPFYLFPRIVVVSSESRFARRRSPGH